MKVSKIFEFDAAHMLDTHDGKCRNLHGHTYRLEVTLSGSLLQGGPKDGMVCDFADLKSSVQQWVLSRFDHAFLYDCRNSHETELGRLLESWGRKTLALPCRTTAENMAVHIFDSLRQHKLPVAAVKLWETPSSCVEYTGADT